MSRVCGQVYAAVLLSWLDARREREIVAAKREDGVRICRIPIGVVDVRGEASNIKDLVPGEGLAVIHKWGVKAAVQGVGLDKAVKGNSNASTENEPTAEVVPNKLPGAPGKSKLRTKVAFACVIKVAPRADTHVGEHAGAGAKNHGC